MASKSYTWTVGQRYEEIVEASGSSPQADAETAAIAADAAMDTLVTASNTTMQGLEAAVISALGTLQADGASPTEAHVDTLQTAWDALLVAINATQTQVTATKLLTAAAETAAIAAAADDDIVRIASGVKPLDAIVGLDLIKQKIATSKLY